MQETLVLAGIVPHFYDYRMMRSPHTEESRQFFYHPCAAFNSTINAFNMLRTSKSSQLLVTTNTLGHSTHAIRHSTCSRTFNTHSRKFKTIYRLRLAPCLTSITGRTPHQNFGTSPISVMDPPHSEMDSSKVPVSQQLLWPENIFLNPLPQVIPS